MTEISAHDWLRPRLAALCAEADAAGYPRDLTVAVITDVVNGSDFAPGVPPPEEGWALDPGEPAGASSEMAAHQQPDNPDTADIGSFIVHAPRLAHRRGL